MFNSNIPQVNNTNNIQTNNFFCYTNNYNISRNKRAENDNTYFENIMNIIKNINLKNVKI